MAVRTKKRRNTDEIDINPVVGTAGGAVLGSFFGPIGTIIGGLTGLIISTATHESKNSTRKRR